MPSAGRAAMALKMPSGPCNFESLLHAALAKYGKRTGTVLVDHPLTTALEDCSSPDAILAIFEKQAQAFDQFRKGDPKLVKWLGPVVKGLCVLCTSSAVDTMACVVSLSLPKWFGGIFFHPPCRVIERQCFVPL